MWHGIMKILEIQHQDRYGKILWKQEGVKNLLHLRGEEFLLRAAFTGGRVSNVIPENYYLGLDNRATVAEDDEMADINGEPSFAGYERQSIASAGDFTVSLQGSHYQAISPIVAFGASGGTWGPVKNLILSDQSGSLGTLISTAVLDTAITINDGESVTMRLAMSLKDCS
jgi:hypothetical protein